MSNAKIINSMIDIHTFRWRRWISRRLRRWRRFGCQMMKSKKERCNSTDISNYPQIGPHASTIQPHPSSEGSISIEAQSIGVSLHWKGCASLKDTCISTYIHIHTKMYTHHVHAYIYKHMYTAKPSYPHLQPRINSRKHTVFKSIHN